MFRFEDPYLLALLLVLPFVIFLNQRRGIYSSLRVSTLGAVKGLKPSLILRLNRLLPVIKYAALALMILGIAGPQWGTRHLEIQTKGVNIILAVDLSESMAALDFKYKDKTINRLEAVKMVVREFIADRSGDRIGMVVFGSEAYTQLPLTRDYNTISSVISQLKIGAAGKSTAIGDAVGISLKRLSDIESKTNVIILLTDGRSNAGQLAPRTAAEIAAQQKVKIYTVGVGTRGRVPFLIKDPVFGDRYVYQRVDIDEATLKTVAEKTGGAYFRAEDTQGLRDIYAKIDKLEKTEIKMKTFAEYQDHYFYLVLSAIILIGLYVLLSNTRLLRLT